MNDQRIEQIMAMLTSFATEYGLKIIGALIILMIGYTAAKIFGKATAKALRKSKLDGALVKFLAGLVRFGVIIFTWISALETFGIRTTSFIAVLGAAGLAVGLALQGSLSNFASGVMLLFLRPFSDKDYIKVAGFEGEVIEIGILTTTLNTSDNQKVIIPNSTVFSNTIVNVSGNPQRRVDLSVRVSYGQDVEKVRTPLLEAVGKHPLVLKDPAPSIEVMSLEDSYVKIGVFAWTKTESYGSAVFQLNQLIKETLAANGIDAPVPHRNVYIHQSSIN